jgi:predicted O-methyltransferase YrrM
MKPENYLEIGVYRGETLRKVRKYCGTSYGVDIDPEAIRSVAGLPNVSTYLGTAEEFVQAHPALHFDFIFIDASHKKADVVHDFKVLSERVTTNGLVAFHDTWPGTEDFTSQKFCGDAYLAIADLREAFSLWNFVTIPVHPGLTLAQRTEAVPSWVHSKS